MSATPGETVHHWTEPPARDPLSECVHGSRLIGSDPDLVLHGGGNTSIKADYTDITGRSIEAIYVKGSGWDLATIEPRGFTPLRLERLRELLELEALPDLDMMRELSAARLDPEAPSPSVESLLHALIPDSSVLHSHADVIVTLTNVADGEGLVREVLGRSVIVVPYVMPGFDLAKAVAAMWPGRVDDGATGMVLLNHGLFTFGPTTRIAYERHVAVIERAMAWLREHAPTPPTGPATLSPVGADRLASLRNRISRVAGRPMIMTRHTDERSARFVSRPDLPGLATRGPLTPDHVIRTKPVPMIGTDVDAYASAYERYFAANAARVGPAPSPLDPAPRVVVDRELGVLTIGETPAAAEIVADIYAHTIPVLERCEDHLGGYVGLGAGELFDVEYWDLEQAKLRRGGRRPPLSGAVAVVTGAASGIGRACAAELMARGAAVAGLDVDTGIADTFDGPGWLGLPVDVTDQLAQARAVDRAVERFGGVDVVVAAAGIFGEPGALGDVDLDSWRSIHAVNVDSVATLLATVHPLLVESPLGGRVALVGSKNVAAPGRRAAAYSSSKAALTQLARVTALEWADRGIRVNVVHPDAVFDTALWTDDLIASRAAEHGVSVEAYRTRNLLGVEIDSTTVARAVVELCTDTFAATTGAQIPVDGGNERVI